MKAIILAAGYGSRMTPLAQDTPKCLLNIGKETILGRQLRLLKSCAIENIAIVTGFHQEKIKELYGQEATIYHNPHFETTGSIFALWTARDFLTEDTVILSSDIVFTEEPLKNLLADSNPFCLVVDKKLRDPGSWKVKVANDLIVDVSKTISQDEAYGKFIGMVKVKKEGMELFKQSLFNYVKEDSRKGWPEVFQDLAKKGHRVNSVLIDTVWQDIDTKEDYDKAKKLFEK